MKYIKKINELFDSHKDGDKIIDKILDIVEEENITILNSGGYRITIDNRIYSFADYNGFGLNHTCRLGIYNTNQKNGNYIIGKPISEYNFSYKLWKRLEKLYKNQNIKKSGLSDLEELNDIVRTSKRYNL